MANGGSGIEADEEGKILRALPASQLFSAMPPLEAVKLHVSIMMSVGLSNKGKPLKLRHNDISRAHFQGTAQRLIYIRLPTEDRQKYGEDKVGRLIKSMYGTQDASHIWELDDVKMISGELGGFRRGKHSATLSHNPNEDVRMAVHGDDFGCLSDDDGLKHIDSLLKYTAKCMGTLGIEDSDVRSFLLLNRVFRVGTDQTGQYLDVGPDLRHAPLIISESGCNTNTKAVSTPREKTTLKRAARYLVGKPKAALRFRRQKHVDKITVFVDSDFAGDPVSRKSTTGLVAQIGLTLIGNHTVKPGSTLQSLTALSVGEAEFYEEVKGGQVGASLRSIHKDLGTPMKIEVQSSSSTANSLTDRLGAGRRMKHMDTRYFWVQERVQDGDLSIKKVPTAKNYADVGTMLVSASVLQQQCQFAGLDPTHHYKMKVTSL